MPRSATVEPTVAARREKSASVKTAAVVDAHATTQSVLDASAEENASAAINASADSTDLNIF
jgi:hypothetical protein